MPAQGALIRATDYIDVRRQIARILGDRILEYSSDPDRGKYGYGQSVLSDNRNIVREVSFPDDLDLATLRSDVLKIAAHCGVDSNPLITALPIVNQGDLIDNNHLDAYLAAIPLLNNSRFQLGAGQYSDEALISSTRSTTWGASWYYGEETVRHSFRVDFGSGNNARYFFNSGGQLRFSASRIGGATNPHNTSWTNLLSSMGTIVFDYNNTTASSGIGSNIGFYDLTGASQQIFTKTSEASLYAANDYTITMSCDVANNSLGEARYIYVDVYFNDDHEANFEINDTVSGTLTSTVNIRRATGSNVQVPAPNANNTVVL